MNKKELIKTFWETIEIKQSPRYLRNVINLESKKFIKNLKKNNFEYILDLILKLYSGDVLILKKAIDKKYIDQLKKNLVSFSSKNPSSFYKINEGCPNFWRRQDENIAKKYSFKAVRTRFIFLGGIKKNLRFGKHLTIYGVVLKYSVVYATIHT